MRFPVKKLITIIRKNRARHRQIFEEALEGYRQELVQILSQRINEIRKGKRVTHLIQMETPMDMTREYDRVIRMLELTQDKTIELNGSDFAAYVMDQWQWKTQFLASNTRYSKTAELDYARSEV